MSCTAYVVLIETSSNQHFIFSSNRMRENVGASELVRQVGMVWVPTALKAIFGHGPNPCTKDVKTADFVTSLRASPGAIETDEFEVILATSGKALLLVKDKAQAEELIWHVTKQAATTAPGLVVRGAVSQEIDVASRDKGLAADRVRDVHQRLEQLKHDLPPALARSPHLPLLQPCVSSGLPSELLVPARGSTPQARIWEAVSLATREKDQLRDIAYARMVSEFSLPVTQNYKKFDELSLPWQAIIHADGNGFGKVFLTLDQCSAVSDARTYFNTLRAFSLSLELCSLVAFEKALDAFPQIEEKTRTGEIEECPIVPLVIGGDDLTVVCDGRRALDFTARYLRAFEEATAAPELRGQQNAIPEIAGKMPQQGGSPVAFAAGAGVAIVKPHFPFHRAYELSESLLKSAKTVKRILDRTDVSSLDFQIVYDDGASDLKSAREPWQGEDLSLHARPYVITTAEKLEGLTKVQRTWAVNRLYWSIDAGPSLVSSVEALGRKKDEESADLNFLPRGQQKAMRDALFLGANIVEGRWKAVKRHYPKFDWPGGEILFADKDFSTDPEKDIRATRFLDALEVLDVSGRLKGEPVVAAAGAEA